MATSRYACALADLLVDKLEHGILHAWRELSRSSRACTVTTAEAAMTYQRDPERPNEPLTPEKVARGTEGFGLIPVIAGAVIVVGLVVAMVWSAEDQTPRPADVPTTTTPQK
jgi:hypothetical protein